MNTFDWHSVVERCATSSYRSVTLQVDQICCCRLSNELCFQFGVLADSEGDVDSGTIYSLAVVYVVALAGIDEVVEELGAFHCFCFHGLKASLLDHVGDVETTHVDWPA